MRFATLLLALALPLSARSPLRLYVFDCGKLTVDDPSRFDFKKEELKVLDLAVPCYLIVHPKGSLMWDTGVVPDNLFPAGGGAAHKEYATSLRPLRAQMAEVGFKPENITYLALSHYHWDHVGNAWQFSHSKWLVSKIEYDQMFSSDPPPRTDAALFAPLKKTKTVFLPDQDYDVFGDGTVVIKPTPGHTPGHRVLFLKLEHTGPIVLAGDLYHYREELTTGRVMKTDPDQAKVRASRAALDEFLKQTGAQLWIQHELVAFQAEKKSPQYYD